MVFPDDVIRQAWERSGGQCECQKRTHAHFYVPCAKPLVGKTGVKKAGGDGTSNMSTRTRVILYLTLKFCV